MTTCGLCGLLCDDLSIDANGAARLPAGATCQLVENRHPHLSIEEIPLEAYRQQLADTPRPLILCGGCDVATARSLIALARQTGATLASQWPITIPSHYTATLEEVIARSTVVVAVGSVFRDFPRLRERLGTAAALARSDSSRQLFALEGPPSQDGNVRDRLITLCGLLGDRPRAQDASESLRSVATALGSASHVALLSSREVDAATQASLHDLWNQLDQITTARLVSLDPRPGRITLHNVATWDSGFQPPIDFAAAQPQGRCFHEVSDALRRGTYSHILAVNLDPAGPLQPPSTSDCQNHRYTPATGYYFRADGVLILPVQLTH